MERVRRGLLRLPVWTIAARVRAGHGGRELRRRVFLQLVAPAIVAASSLGAAQEAEKKPAPLPARAAPLLQWEAPAECPLAEEMQAAVERLAGESSARLNDAEVRIKQIGLLWVAELRTENGIRAVRGKTCREVADAAAVIWALSVAPVDATTNEPQSDTPEIATEVATPRSLERETSSASGFAAGADDSGSRGSLRFGISLRLLGEMGNLPEPTVGLAGRLRIGSTRAFGEFALLKLFPRSAGVESSPGRGGEIDWFAGQVAGCVAPFASALLFACGGTEIGRLTGTGFGVDHPTSESALWVAPTGTLTWRLVDERSFQLEAGLGFSVPLLRPTFTLDRLAVYRPAPVSGRLELGIGWH